MSGDTNQSTKTPSKAGSNTVNPVDANNGSSKSQKGKKRREQKTYDLTELFQQHEQDIGNWADATKVWANEKQASINDLSSLLNSKNDDVDDNALIEQVDRSHGPMRRPSGSYDRRWGSGAPPSHSRSSFDHLVPYDAPFEAFITNIPFSANQEDVFYILGGEDRVADIFLNTDGLKSLGTARVEFVSRNALIDVLNTGGIELFGRILKINLPSSYRQHDNEYPRAARESRGQYNEYGRNEYSRPRQRGGYHNQSSCYDGSQTDRQSYSLREQPPSVSQRHQRNCRFQLDGSCTCRYDDRRHSTYGGSSRPLCADLPPRPPMRNHPDSYGSLNTRRPRYGGESCTYNYREQPLPPMDEGGLRRRNSFRSLDNVNLYSRSREGNEFDPKIVERPKLNLLPRNKLPELPDKAPLRSAKIFGEAKPVDTREKELEAEERLRREDEALRRSEEPGLPVLKERTNYSRNILPLMKSSSIARVCVSDGDTRSSSQSFDGPGEDVYTRRAPTYPSSRIDPVSLSSHQLTRSVDHISCPRSMYREARQSPRGPYKPRDSRRYQRDSRIYTVSSRNSSQSREYIDPPVRSPPCSFDYDNVIPECYEQSRPRMADAATSPRESRVIAHTSHRADEHEVPSISNVRSPTTVSPPPPPKIMSTNSTQTSASPTPPPLSKKSEPVTGGITSPAPMSSGSKDGESAEGSSSDIRSNSSSLRQSKRYGSRTFTRSRDAGPTHTPNLSNVASGDVQNKPDKTGGRPARSSTRSGKRSSRKKSTVAKEHVNKEILDPPVTHVFPEKPLIPSFTCGPKLASLSTGIKSTRKSGTQKDAKGDKIDETISGHQKTNQEGKKAEGKPSSANKAKKKAAKKEANKKAEQQGIDFTSGNKFALLLDQEE
ncbi:hypothetical protein AB6A40_004737 [Gnathostoma spinigerum]|uniref:RRM domain-containing protein n=1 Tax=Gnathostoma spinigerum TaxID=75299 RepID=A0ABD6EM40_9BILA